MPDPTLAQLSCCPCRLSAFGEQHPFSGQVWSCLLNQGLLLPWVRGAGVAVWIKSAPLRVWPLWQIRGDDSRSPTKDHDGKTCLGRDSSPRFTLAGHGVSAETMSFPSAGFPGRGSEEEVPALPIAPISHHHPIAAVPSAPNVMVPRSLVRCCSWHRFCISGMGSPAPARPRTQGS